mgnify:CR=1 FL=1
MNFNSHVVKGNSLDYEVRGDVNEKRIIFLPAIRQVKESFNMIANGLEDQYKLYLIDNRGHGNSIKEGPYTLNQICEDLYSLFCKEEIGKASIVAASFSCIPALIFSSKYPDMVESIIMLDGGFYNLNEHPYFDYSLLKHDVQELILKNKHEFEIFLNNQVQMIVKDLNISPFIKRFIKNVLKKNYWIDTNGFFRHKTSEFIYKSYLQDLLNIDVYALHRDNHKRKLLIQSDISTKDVREQQFFIDAIEKTKRNSINLEIRYIQNSHHFLMLTNPEECIALIREFLNY